MTHQEEGTYQLLSQGPEGWRVHLTGARIRRVYSLTVATGDNWVLVCEAGG